jgi:hypothetical protein
MLAHIASYKAMVKTWPNNPPAGGVSYEEAILHNTAMLPFPRQFPIDVAGAFNQLKQRQTALLGLIGSKMQQESPDSPVAGTMPMPPVVVPSRFGRTANRPARKGRAK